MLPSARQLLQDGKIALNFQADGENLNNRLNVIDFGGSSPATPSVRQKLFSAPGRCVLDWQ